MKLIKNSVVENLELLRECREYLKEPEKYYSTQDLISKVERKITLWLTVYHPDTLEQFEEDYAKRPR